MSSSFSTLPEMSLDEKKYFDTDLSLFRRLKKISEIKNISTSLAINEAIHQYVVNQERFIQSLKRHEHRDVDRSIYRYCPDCLCQVNSAYIRKKTNGKSRRVRIGNYCDPCDKLWPVRAALGIVEVRRERGYDKKCPNCHREFKNWKGVKIHQTKMRCYK